MSGLAITQDIQDLSSVGGDFWDNFNNLSVEKDDLPPSGVGLDFSEFEHLLMREWRYRRYVASDLYLRGRPVGCWNSRNLRDVSELVFNVPQVYNAVTLQDTEDLCQKIQTSAYHGRLVMPTGAGKSTRFPGYLCNKLKKRVLLLVPSVGLLYYTKKGLERNGAKTRIRDPGSDETVLIMTYADFVHSCAYDTHVRYRKLNLGAILVDECHEKSAYAYAVKAILATLIGQVSVVLLSATQEGEDMQMQRKQKTVMTVESGYVFEKIFSDERWSTTWRKDRTCVFLPDDLSVARLSEYLVEKGYVVHCLDNASTWKEVVDLEKVFAGASKTVRILLAVTKYGTGYSLPVSHVIDSGLREIFRYDVKSVTKEYAPLFEEEVVQHAGRAGRTVAGGNTYVILNTNRLSGSLPIVPGERMMAWLLLKICGIRPNKTLLQGSASIFGSKPLVTRIAAGYFDTMLPLPIYHSLLGSDGNVMPKYINALKQWLYVPQKVLMPSCDNHREDMVWVEEDMSDYMEADVKIEHKVLVPFSSIKEYKVLAHSISLVAEDLIKPVEEVFMVDVLSDDSGDESDVGISKSFNLRRLKAKLPPLPVEESPSSPMDMVRTDKFNYDDMLSDEVVQRRMTVYQKAKKQYEIRSLDDQVILKIPEAIMHSLLLGGTLRPNVLKMLIKKISDDSLYLFVSSEVFDKWGEAWVGLTTTLSDASVLGTLDGIQKVKTSHIVKAMTSRFDRDVSLVVSMASQQKFELTRSFMSRLFRRFAPSEEFGKSLLWVDQSVDFVKRIAQIHDLLCRCVTVHESVGVYSPTLNKWFSTDVPWGGGSVSKGKDGTTGLGKLKRLKFV